MSVRFFTIAFIAVLPLLFACSKKRARESEPAPAADPGSSPEPAPTAGSGSAAPKPPAPHPGNGAAFRGVRGRLSPEQFSALIKSAFQFEQTVTVDSFGLQWDRVVERYGVQLGGIDFESSFSRDGTPTAQMILAARAVAIDYAVALVKRDRIQIDQGLSPYIFTLCSLTTDRPFEEGDSKAKAARQAEIHAGEVRWRAQLEDFFWRLLSRAPSEAEVDAARKAFLDTWHLEKGNERRAWIVVLFALLSSAELWAL